MPDFVVHRPHPEAPARASFLPHRPSHVSDASDASDAWRSVSAQRFEVVSRGDFVPGVLYTSDSADSRRPLLVIPHSTASGRLDFALPWVEDGLAIATLDLPLHGERSSPKLSQRLREGMEQLAKGKPHDPETRALVEEFARQSTSDLIRTIDALAALPSIDGDRIAFLGLGFGAIVGSYLLAENQRVGAGVLAFMVAGRGKSDLDPIFHLPRSKGAPILFVTEEARDNPKGNACFDAAPEPKRRLVVADASDALSARAARPIRKFLDESWDR